MSKLDGEAVIKIDSLKIGFYFHTAAWHIFCQQYPYKGKDMLDLRDISEIMMALGEDMLQDWDFYRHIMAAAHQAYNQINSTGLDTSVDRMGDWIDTKMSQEDFNMLLETMLESRIMRSKVFEKEEESIQKKVKKK